MPAPGWQLLREGFPERPEIGPALCRVLLEQVAAGQRPATIRISRPGRVVAFGRRDVVSPGYRDAVDAAAEAGFPGMERLSGGRAAAFSEGALSFTVTQPDPRPAERTEQRFEVWASLLRDVFEDLGVDARIGPVPDEYCPGEYSINSGGLTKLAGAGQRMIRGAAHTGFVILVADPKLVADVLEPVYEALELDFNRGTVGSLDDEVPTIDRESVEHALLRKLRTTIELEEVELDPFTRETAISRSPKYRSVPTGGIV